MVNKFTDISLIVTELKMFPHLKYTTNEILTKICGDLLDDLGIYEYDKYEEFPFDKDLISEAISENHGTLDIYNPIRLAIIRKLTTVDDECDPKKKMEFTVYNVGYASRLQNMILPIYSEMRGHGTLVYLSQSTDILPNKAKIVRKMLSGQYIDGLCFENSTGSELSAIQIMRHCGCLGDDPYRTDVIEQDNIKVTVYTYDTESG